MTRVTQRHLWALILCLSCYSWAAAQAPTAEPSATPDARDAFIQKMLRQGSGQRQADTKPTPLPQATPIPGAITLPPFLKNPWILVLIVFTGFGIFMYGHQRYLKPKKPAETGKLATPEEQHKVYGIPFGLGGYLLGRPLPPKTEATVGHQVVSVVKRLTVAPPPTHNVGKGEDPTLLRIPFELRTRHCITEAGTGAGKTTSLILPQLIEDGASGICNDFLIDRKSPEIYQQAAGAWACRGHRAILFDPWDKGLTSAIEPLFGATPDAIRAMVEAHVQISFDPADTTKFYREQERALIETLFICAQEWGKRDRRLATLPAVAELVALGFETTRIAIQNARPDLNRRLVDQWKMTDSDLAKVFRSIDARLRVYLIPEVSAVFSKQDFSINDLVVPYGSGGQRQQRTLLIIGANQAKGGASELIASFMTHLVMHAVYERGLQMKRDGRRWTDVTPLAMWFDEIGTYSIGRWEDFLAVARDGGVAITSALQDRLQFDRINGPHASQRLLKNHTHKIFLRGVDIKTAEELSKEIGEEWNLDEGTTRSSGRTAMGNTSTVGTQKRWQARPIRSPEEIVRMPQDQALVLGPAVDPFEVRLVPYYESPALAETVSTSIQWVRTRRNRNLQCDREGVARDMHEPPLHEAVANWSPVWSTIVGEDVIRTGTVAKTKPQTAPAEKQMTKKLRNKIEAKCRDLAIADVNLHMVRKTGKSLDEFTEADALDVIKYLEKWEQSASRNKSQQTSQAA